MTVFAMSTGLIVLAWIGLAVGLVIAVVVVGLFNSIMRPLSEIDDYAKDILDGGLGIARNLDGADAIVHTHELATAVPPLAVAYLKRLGAL